MKIDQPKLQSAYIAKIFKICEDCDDKSHFGIPEIISIIATLLETGRYYIQPPNSSVLELCAIHTKLSPEWSKETIDFVDELFSRLEHAETEVIVFDARLAKQWTVGSNLYTEKEMNDETTKAYNQGYEDGSNHYYGEDCPVLKQRVEALESTLNTIYHSTSCTTYQMELINEVCPQNEPQP